MLPAAHWMGESAETELSGLNDTSSEIMNIESLPFAMFMLQHWYLLVHQNMSFIHVKVRKVYDNDEIFNLC